jgi:hypothetical protein
LLFKSSPGSAAGRQNKTDSVSDPAAAGPGAVGNLSANDHAANSARGYNRAIHVGFTVSQRDSSQLSSVQYGLNVPSVSGTWAVPGTSGSRVEKSITGLSDGTTYTVYVRGCNNAGRCGPWTGPSNKVTPYGRPRAPSVGARADGTSITYSWSGGGDNGRPVSSYRVCFDASSCTRTRAGSITEFYGQSQTHTITVSAIDSAGQHSATASASATTATAPSTTSPYPTPTETCPPGISNVDCIAPSSEGPADRGGITQAEFVWV